MPYPLERESLTNLCDVLVIGGGINGTAIARDAALRGLRVILVEKDDLAAGTSSWSSRMIHGGLRYLEHGEVRLVRESLHEREVLLRQAPHLVRPYPLLIPFYAHNRRGRGTLRAGMAAYDALSWDKSTPWHRILPTSKLRERWPGLRRDGLTGAALYFDAQAPWAERLSVENALAARESGADVRTHTGAIGLLRGPGASVVGARCRDARSGAEYDVAAGLTVNAAGPWIDRVAADVTGTRLIGGTKGSHLVVDPFPGAPRTGVHYEASSDGRAVLVLPWAGRYLIGATDLYFDDDPGKAVTSDAEIDYLLAETNRLIPGAGLTPGDVLFSYCGVRPLPYAPDAASTADVSRDHVIHDHAPEAPGLLSIIGGKLTTHRALAEQTVDQALRLLGLPRQRSVTSELALPGARTGDWPAFRATFTERSGLDPAMSDRLLGIYGTRAADVLALARSEPGLATEFVPGALAAEVVHAFRAEQAGTLGDVLLRRTMLGLAPDVGLGAVEPAAEIAIRRGLLEPGEAGEQVEDYRATVRRFRPRAAAGR